ncbi:preprotein translocase subunit YajC [Lactobacillus sp.]|uniref:preprotein translocase subunit YajC n=1 Tax=Lactobacillus sp. TaxID=1591 RepID=UPI001994D368|nr:preprotein translocase subunit YajC [Lactobacillus sp.]MBD5429977.1 preprotein translocase subunit YajC [Lactobacillus sp.]
MNIFMLAQAAGGNNSMMMIIILIALFAFSYFAMIRPQKKQQQKRMEMMNELKAGDRVVLVDGLHGKIDSINKDDNTVVVDANGIFLTFSRMAIRQVLPAKASEDKNVEKQEEASEANEETAKTNVENSDVKADDKKSESNETSTADEKDEN